MHPGIQRWLQHLATPQHPSSRTRLRVYKQRKGGGV